MTMNTNGPHQNVPDDTYYHEANSWRDDLFTVKEKQISLYRKVSICLFFSLTLAMGCVTSLVIRERVQPFLVMVDKRSGEVTTPSRLTPQSLAVNWKMIRHLVTTYVTHRESYSASNLNEPYETVCAMSSEQVISQVDLGIRPELNPQSPIKTLGQHHYIKVTIHSIAPLGKDNLLDIRFTTHTVNSETHSTEQSKEWRATLKWAFVEKQRSLAQWDRNPLGFTVNFYDKQPVAS